jgi:hypothetical protein
MRVIRLAAAAASVALIGTLVSVLPASAAATCDPSASINAQMNSSDAGLSCPPSPTAENTVGKGDSGTKTGKSGSGVKPACVWVPKPDYPGGGGGQVEGKGGHWYQKFCSFGAYKTLADFQRALGNFDVMNTQQTNMLRRAGLEVRYFTTPPPAPRRTPQQVMASIVDSLPIPDTFIAVNPVPAKQVVSFPTWVWLTDANGQFVPDRYGQKSKTIAIEGYQLQWQIVPQLTVAPGDGGTEQACDGAGLPWSAAVDGDPGACTVTYDRSGQYTLSASVGWTVQWWLGGARQGDITGPTKTATRPVTVLEIQALTR